MAAPLPKDESDQQAQALRTAGVAAGVASAVVLLVLIGGGLLLAVADYLGVRSPQGLLGAIKRAPYVSSVMLVALEEGGLPVPVPGDVAIMYAAQAVPRHLTAWAAIWVALFVAVVTGSSVLFAIGRRWGTKLAHGRLGVALHLNEDRLKRLEGWFSRWGAIAVFGGRLLPGGRQPISAAAGTFGVRYPVFLASTAAAALVWITAFVILGVTLGPKAEQLLNAHRSISTALLAIGLLGGFGYIGFRLLTVRPERPTISQ